MEKLLSLTASIAGFAVFTALLSILLPDGKFKKAGTFLCSLCLLFIFIEPWTHENLFDSISNNTSLFSFQNIEENDSYLVHKNESYEKMIQKNIVNLLEKNNISVEEIALKTKIQEESVLLLEEVCITVPTATKEIKEKIETLLFKELEIPAEVLIIQEAGETT